MSRCKIWRETQNHLRGIEGGIHVHSWAPSDFISWDRARTSTMALRDRPTVSVPVLLVKNHLSTPPPNQRRVFSRPAHNYYAMMDREGAQGSRGVENMGRKTMRKPFNGIVLLMLEVRLRRPSLIESSRAFVTLSHGSKWKTQWWWRQLVRTDLSISGRASLIPSLNLLHKPASC